MQHSNECLVKLGAQMTSTGGKSEIIASIFAITSNDFMPEYHEDTHYNPTNQPAEAPPEVPGEEEPKQRNCGNNKLFDLE
jgi:hypothetical protein